MKILYLVHDLADPAVGKRLSMLQAGGATVTVMGFRRTFDPVPAINGCHTINLRQTYNGQFGHRLGAVFCEALTLKKHRAVFQTADVIIARSLEMLALAVQGRGLCTPQPVLVYECLDIHRLLLAGGLVGAALRWLEGWLGKRAAALLTSSPAFISDYFQSRSRLRLPIRLVENKVFGVDPPIVQPRPSGPPWRIGWFGAIRCQQSLRILTELVEAANGVVEVVIRGRPALDQFANFAADTTKTPHLRFLGPYANPTDLTTIYQDVHFTWAIDRFEAGQNSAWLLPNRLYEGGLYGAIPLAEQAVETGRFLENLGIGVRLAEPLAASLADFFRTLTPERYQDLAAELAGVSPGTWVCEPQDCRELVEFLATLCHSAPA